MRTLTDEEVAQEVEMMTNLSNWPLRPVLPLKNLYRRADQGDNDLGVMLEDNQTIVYIINMLDLGKPGALMNAPREKFDSIEDLVRAGWVGD